MRMLSNERACLATASIAPVGLPVWSCSQRCAGPQGPLLVLQLPEELRAAIFGAAEVPATTSLCHDEERHHFGQPEGPNPKKPENL